VPKDSFSNNKNMSDTLTALNQRIEELELHSEEYLHESQINKALFEIAALYYQTKDTVTFYQKSHFVLKDVIYAENFFIAEYDEDTDALSFPYFVDTVDHTMSAAISKIPIEDLKHSLTAYALELNKPVFLNSKKIARLQKEGKVKNFGADCSEWIGVPLRVGDKSIGLLVVQSYQVNKTYSETDFQFIQFVATLFAQAIDKKRAAQTLLEAQMQLESRVEKRTRALRDMNIKLQKEIVDRQRAEEVQHALFQIAELATTTEHFEEFYKSIHQVISKLFSANNFCIALLNKDETELEFKYFVDEFDETPAPIPLFDEAAPQRITLHVLQSRTPLLIDKQNPVPSHLVVVGQPIRSWLGVPLLDENQCFGVVILQSYNKSEQYTAQDLELMVFISQHIANALSRKSVSKKLQEANLRLMEHHEKLEQRVSDRTNKLFAANEELKKLLLERDDIQNKLKHDARHDPLTSLPNRAYFLHKLSKLIHHKKGEKPQQYAVVFLDLDRFKIINDSLGHMVGDQLLQKVSFRILECVRPSDIVARLGGDEFCILLTGNVAKEVCERVAQRIIKSFSESFDLVNNQIFTSTSIGIALFSEEYNDPADVLRDADAAMYEAKAAGKGCYRFFNNEMRNDALMRLQLESELRFAIESDDIEVYFQPIVDIQSNKLVAFEALARWNHKEKGFISPVDFVPVAEETGLIKQMGKIILQKSVEALMDWHKLGEGAQELMVSVNISSRQLADPNCYHFIQALLDKTKLPSNRLKIEVTESLLVDNFEYAKKLLKQLRMLGVHILLDDFGTGYSSLSYVHHFPIDGIKMDRSFIYNMELHDEHKAVVRSVYTLAEGLKKYCVAEGIETEQQLNILKSMGFHLGQGYLFAKPMNQTDTIAFIKNNMQKESAK
jgi:diguanylate cyclase (GGDEF)-like protein